MWNTLYSSLLKWKYTYYFKGYDWFYMLINLSEDFWSLFNP